jgi:hypothetical protein
MIAVAHTYSGSTRLVPETMASWCRSKEAQMEGGFDRGGRSMDIRGTHYFRGIDRNRRNSGANRY